MNHQLKHIFDSSACLTKRQLKDYVSGTMAQEEQYAVEHHITTCFFCSEALDGMMQREDEALAAVDELNANFLKDHFSLINPQIHLNSIAPSVQAQPVPRTTRRKASIPLLKPSTIAAALILGLGALWYLERDDNMETKGRIAQVASTPAGTSASSASSQPEAVKFGEREMTAQPATNIAVENKSILPSERQPDEQQRPQALVATNPETNKDKTEAAKTQKTEVGIATDNDTESKILAKTETREEIEKTGKPAVMAFSAPATRESDRTASEEQHAGNTTTSENAGKKGTNRKVSSEAIAAESADELYASGKYRAALNAYRKQMNAAGTKDEQYAALQAARCYINMGQKESAIKLLQSLTENGSGSSKRQAKRLLKEINKEKVE